LLSPLKSSYDIQVRKLIILRIAMRLLKKQMNIETERMAVRMKRIDMQIRILCKIMGITGR
jgi:hypothetical protein